MILLFLGSWRSTLIVCISIPLSILTSLIVLNLLGETINVMTLGGLALAVGILVDDATVEIENIHRNLGMKKPLTRAILDGAQQIAVPAFVSTLAICIVFVPVLLLTGAASYLFTPLAMAVVFAMLASYLLSRTLVPTMVHYLLRQRSGALSARASTETREVERHHLARRITRSTASSSACATAIAELLAWALDHRALVAGLFGVFVLGSLALVLFVGEDFFPYVDAGQMRLHVRAPAGTRIEETEQIFARVEDEIRADDSRRTSSITILDNIGLPNSGINLAFSDSATDRHGDGEILISLKPEKHGPTQEYDAQAARRAAREISRADVLLPAGRHHQPDPELRPAAPIDVQVVGPRRRRELRDRAGDCERGCALIPGAVDVHIHQEVDYPEVRRQRRPHQGATRSG